MGTPEFKSRSELFFPLYEFFFLSILSYFRPSFPPPPSIISSSLPPSPTLTYFLSLFSPFKIPSFFLPFPLASQDKNAKKLSRTNFWTWAVTLVHTTFLPSHYTTCNMLFSVGTSYTVDVFSHKNWVSWPSLPLGMSGKKWRKKK